MGVTAPKTRGHLLGRTDVGSADLGDMHEPLQFQPKVVLNSSGNSRDLGGRGFSAVGAAPPPSIQGARGHLGRVLPPVAMCAR